MRGKIDRDGTVTITFNIQHECLYAPDASGKPEYRTSAQWLPCEWCSGIAAVPHNTVSFTCHNCQRVLDSGETLDLIYQGRGLRANEEGGCGIPDREFHDIQMNDPESWVYNASCQEDWLKRALCEQRESKRREERKLDEEYAKKFGGAQ